MKLVYSAYFQSGACLIDDECYHTGDVNPDNDALQCDPGTDNTGWTVVGRKSGVHEYCWLHVHVTVTRISLNGIAYQWLSARLW